MVSFQNTHSRPPPYKLRNVCVFLDHSFRSWNGNKGSDPTKAMCNAFTRFSKKQRHLCTKYPDLMEHIFLGAKMAVEECGRQMSTNRWNCSNVAKQGSLFGPILSVGESIMCINTSVYLRYMYPSSLFVL